MEKQSKCGWLHTPLRATILCMVVHLAHSWHGIPGAPNPLGTAMKKKNKKTEEQALHSYISLETKNSFPKAPLC